MVRPMDGRSGGAKSGRCACSNGRHPCKSDRDRAWDQPQGLEPGFLLRRRAGIRGCCLTSPYCGKQRNNEIGGLMGVQSLNAAETPHRKRWGVFILL